MTTDWQNEPLINADYPDPDVICVDHVYYMITISMYFFPGGELLVSDDLVHWRHGGYVFDHLDHTPAQRLASGQNIYGKGMWAATLRYHRGEFYVLFVANDTHQTYLYRASQPQGPWRKQLVAGFYHDASLLFDDGRAYLAYGNDEIHLTELNAELSGPRPGGLNRVIVSDHHNPRLGYEGSHLYRIYGRYYLFLIHSLRDRWMRTEACFSADTLDGPWSGGDVWCDDAGYFGSGVAQGGIVSTPNGWVAVLFQDRGALGRVPMLVPVIWRDHQPIFGSGPLALPTLGQEQAPLAGDDAFSQPLWPAQWQFNHEPDFAHIERGHGALALTTDCLSHDLLDAPNTVTVRMQGQNTIATVTLDAREQKVGDVAGLCAFQGSFGWIGITRMATGYQLMMQSRVAQGNNTYLAPQIVQQPLIEPVVRLRLQADFEDMADTVQFSFEAQGAWHDLGPLHHTQFNLDLFTGCRVGLFAYATATTGGSVRFSNFTLKGEQG